MNYDDLADGVASDIAMLGAALQGLYLSRMTPGRAVGPADVQQFLAAASGVRTSVHQQIQTRLDAWRFQLPALTDSVQLHMEHTSHVLAQMGGHMTAQLAARMRHGKSIEERLLSHMGGAMGQLVQQRYERVRLTAIDTAGREWEASMLARVVARDFAVKSEFDARVSAYRDAGIDKVRVDHRALAYDAEVFSLSDESMVQAVREIAFHPNSNSKLEPYVVQA